MCTNINHSPTPVVSALGFQWRPGSKTTRYHKFDLIPHVHTPHPFQIDQALEELESGVQELSSFHRGERPQATPSFLSTVPQEPYHVAEDRFLSELTAYTKKYFFQVRATGAERVVLEQ